MGLKWERLAAIRTVILIVGGSAALVGAAFQGLGVWAGLATIGLLCLFLEYMTGAGPGAPNERRQ